MKNAAILGAIAVAFLVVLSLRKNKEAIVLEEKIHELQDHFKSLDAVAV